MKTRHDNRWRRSRAGPLARAVRGSLLALVLAGCATAPGEVFPPLDPPLLWPAAPAVPRIRYVGQLVTDQDLKPGHSALQGLERSLFGQPEARSMLTPFAVATDGGSRLFVADSNARLVHVFDLAGRRYARWQPPEGQPDLGQPVALVYDGARRRLLAADSVAGVVVVFDDLGRLTGTLGQGLLKRPCGLALHPVSGDLYVADAAAHQVVVLSPQGREVRRLGERGMGRGQFNYPTALCFDRTGRLYVVDALNFRVQQFDAGLQPTLAIGRKGDVPGSFSQPKAVACDAEGQVYILDAHFEAVQVFDPAGQLLLTFGREGRQPGEFWLPTGLCIDPANRIWLADSYNRRVQVFDYLPAAAAPAPDTQPAASTVAATQTGEGPHAPGTPGTPPTTR